MESKRWAPHHEPVTGAAILCALRLSNSAAIANPNQNHPRKAVAARVGAFPVFGITTAGHWKTGKKKTPSPMRNQAFSNVIRIFVLHGLNGENPEQA